MGRGFHVAVGLVKLVSPACLDLSRMIADSPGQSDNGYLSSSVNTFEYQVPL